MNFKLALKEDDYLTYTLYTVSKNKQAKTNRMKSWLIMSGCFFVMAYLFYMLDYNFLIYYFLITGLITLVFYPFYQRYKYRNFYKKHVQDIYKYNFGKEVTINIDVNNIEEITENSVGKISNVEIEEINEIGSHYFIKLKFGQAIILPKAVIDESELVVVVNEITKKYHVNLNQDLDWRWK